MTLWGVLLTALAGWGCASRTFDLGDGGGAGSDRGDVGDPIADGGSAVDGAILDGPADGGGPCDGGPQLVDVTARCAAAPSPTVPFATPAVLADLVVGTWLRCEGPIEPVGMPPAPDGQVGLEFDLYAGTNQGGLGAVIPDPGLCLEGVLAYVGGGYYHPVSWAFYTVNGQPGIVFQDTTGTVVYDQPGFSAGGDTMVLTDTLWNGTYVKVAP